MPTIWEHELIASFFFWIALTGLRYFVAAGFFEWFSMSLFKGWFRERKIQSPDNSSGEIRRDIGWSLLTIIIFGAHFAIWFGPLRTHTLLYPGIEPYGVWWLLVSIAVMSIVHDAWFYWVHRLLHQKILFRWFHAIHHEALNPTVWTSFSFHPVEAFLLSLIMPIILILIPVNSSVFIFYLSIQFLQNVYGHCGYEFFSKKSLQGKVGLWLMNGTQHNLHHSKGHSNYGLIFNWWDKLFGTEIRE